MRKVRLGGIKVVEGRSFLSSFCNPGEEALADICYRFAAEGINISLLTHLSGDSDRGTITSICMEDRRTLSSYLLLKLDLANTVRLQADINILSVFPHDERAEVSGTFFRSLAGGGVLPLGFVSSPSAISVVISSADARNAIDGLFNIFELPTYKSPLDWFAAYQGKEHVFKEIICSYQEEVIKVYNLMCRRRLARMKLTVPAHQMDGVGSALLAMSEIGARVPFILGQTRTQEDLLITFCLEEDQRDHVKRIFENHLSGVVVDCDGPVTILYLHGPHFGDRYGIAAALAESLRTASIAPMAVSCAVSSISVVIRSQDEERCVEALSTRFEIPGKAVTDAH
jgi:aspartokinase